MEAEVGKQDLGCLVGWLDEGGVGGEAEEVLLVLLNILTIGRDESDGYSSVNISLVEGEDHCVALMYGM